MDKRPSLFSYGTSEFNLVNKCILKLYNIYR